MRRSKGKVQNWQRVWLSGCSKENLQWCACGCNGSQLTETFEEGKAGQGGSCSEIPNSCRCRMLEGEPLRLEKSKW